jgi:hypothetical protein
MEDAAHSLKKGRGGSRGSERRDLEDDGVEDVVTSVVWRGKTRR